MKKNVIKHARRIEVENVRTPTRTVDPETEEVSYGLSFLLLDGKSSTRYYRPCTREVFKLCYGRHPGKDPNTLAVGGYATVTDYRYLLYLDSKDIKKATVVGVTAIPNNFWGSVNAAPEEIKENKLTVFELNEDGSFRIATNKHASGVTLPAISPTIQKGEMLGVLTALEKSEELAVGDELPMGYEIAELAGNRVSLVKY